MRGNFSELEQIFKALPDGVLVIDMDFNVKKTNRKLCLVKDLSETETIGRKCFELFDSHICHTANCPLKRIADGEEYFDFEFATERVNSITPPFSVTAVPLRDSNNEIIGIIEIIKDISDRKIAEKEFQEIETKYHSYIHQSPDALFISDNLGNYLEINPASCSLLGYSEEELLTMSVRDIAKSDGIIHFTKLIESEVSNGECILIKKDGSEIIADIHAVHLGNDRYMAFVRDVTKNKQTEEALRNSEEQYRLIFENSPLGIGCFDQKGIITHCNSRFAEIMGAPKERVIGFNGLLEIADTSLRAALQKSLKGDIGTFEGEYLSITGKKNSFLRAVFQGIISENGTFLGGIGIFEDISERILAEEALRKTEQHQLKMDKLESVGLLAGGIAHDFNNILTAIIGNVSLMKMNIRNKNLDDKEKLINLLTEIERASNQSKDLTHQLLIFAKGGNPILKTVFIGKLLRESANFALTGSNVLCDYNIPNDLWPVEIDEGQMNQVVHNIVVNAAHAMHEGGILRIVARNIAVDGKEILPLEKGKYVNISFEDGGYGISEENIDKIFDPYFTTKQMGSGLGLTTTHSIIKKHKGTILVDSQVGVGTTFNIYLPASQKVIEEKPTKTRVTLTGKGKVLVMDDEQMLRSVVSEMLQVLGYEAVCVKDGFEAIEVYIESMRTAPFDAVIMDLTVPGRMGGKETIKRLLDIDPNVKAIVSSGYSNNPVMANHKEYGFKDVIAKPYSIEKLGEVLNNVVEI